MSIGSLIGGVVSGVGSIFGNNSAADAAKYAADQQAKSTAAALALQKQTYEQNTANAKPYMSSGTNALNLYGDATGTNGSQAQKDYFNNFQTDPGYQAALKAGTDAVSNSAAARGTLYSGNTLKAINDYGGGMLQKAYGDRMGQLYNLSNQGLSATNALAGVGTSYANNASNTMTNPTTNGTNSQFASGLYGANGIVGVANSLSGAVGYNTGQGNYNNSSGNSGNNANNWLSQPVSSLWS